MTARLALLATVGALGFSSLVAPGQAEAGRFHFGGGARVHVSVPGVRVGWSRPTYSPRATWSVGGSIHFGGGYYPSYRTYRPYYYAPVPSYYGSVSVGASYYPVEPTVVVAAPVAIVRPDLPRFGIGLFAGGVSVQDQSDSSDLGVLGRFRLTPGLLIEGELGKTSYDNDLRVDRRLGAALVYELGAYNNLAPYVLAGIGVQQADVGGQYKTTQDLGEIGIGLRYAISPRVHLAFDVRAGSRGAISTNDTAPRTGVATTGTARGVVTANPPTTETEEYTRARLSAIVYF